MIEIVKVGIFTYLFIGLTVLLFELELWLSSLISLVDLTCAELD